MILWSYVATFLCGVSFTIAGICSFELKLIYKEDQAQKSRRLHPTNSKLKKVS